MNQSTSGLKSACLIGVIAFALVLVLGTALVTPAYQMLASSGIPLTRMMVNTIQVIKNCAGMFIALLVYVKLIAKAKLTVFPAILMAAIYGLACLLTGMIGIAVVSYVIYFAFGTVFGYLYLKMSKTMVSTETGNKTPYAEYNCTATSGTANTSAVPGDMDGLCSAVLNAVRPTLKAPMTAVLCDREQMVITNNNGEYDIQGYVNSQNSYGAMIATDFSVKARYVNGMWVVSKVNVGKKVASNYAKTFVSNYIAISIFVALMGLLGYLILTMVIG